MSRKKKNKPVLNDGMNYNTFNNRVVEATLTGKSVKYGVADYLVKIVGDNGPLMYDYIHYMLGDTYIGRAFCNVEAGEQFDEETGKKIATQRCLEMYRHDFDDCLVKFIEELHLIEARLFNRLRQSGKLDLYAKAKTVDEIYDTSFKMPHQKSFIDVYSEACPNIFSFNPCNCESCDDCESKDKTSEWDEK